MLQFHRTAKAPPNYLAWRQQRKLLLWVLLIGVPIIALLRIWDLRRTEAPQSAAAEGAKIDPRLPESTPLPTLDAFTAEPVTEHDQTGKSHSEQDASTKFFRGVIPEYLKSVRDDTPSRPADHDACFNLFQALHRADVGELKTASLGKKSYVQLFRQPEAYRGKLVDLRGTVRRAHQLPLAKNHTGLTHNYELWLFTEDSQTNPIIVYALDLPEEFPTGMKIHEPVELTGFFFKRVAYGAKGGGMTAPTVLTKTVDWKAPSPAERTATASESRQRLQWLMGVAVFGIILLTVVMWQLNRSTRRPILQRASMSADTVEVLQDADVLTVQEELERLARKE